MADSIQYKSNNVGIATDTDALPASVEIGDQKEFNDAYAKWAEKNGIKTGWGAKKSETFNYGKKAND
jgi:hypothetical protein